MNSFAAPINRNTAAKAQDLSNRNHNIELALYALCSGMTLLLAASAAVMTIAQVG